MGGLPAGRCIDNDKLKIILSVIRAFAEIISDDPSANIFIPKALKNSWVPSWIAVMITSSCLRINTEKKRKLLAEAFALCPEGILIHQAKDKRISIELTFPGTYVKLVPAK